jgi:hypothetical protein
MLADELEYVVGVDTHRDEHVLAIVAAATTTSHVASPRATAAGTPPAYSSATSPAASTGYCKELHSRTLAQVSGRVTCQQRRSD